MSRAGPDKPDLDALLRAALGGDPPQPVEQRLRASLRPAWRRVQAGHPSRLPWSWRPGPFWPLPAPRAALATLAVSMILGGAGWNLARAPQAAASSLSTVMAARAFMKAAASAVIMTCSVEVRDATGRSTTALVEWQADRGTVIRVGDGPPVTIQPPSERRPPTVLSDMGGTPRGQPSPLDLPVAALGDFLSPARVAAALEGTWESTATQADAGSETYRVARVDGPPVTLTLDSGSGLPCLITTPDVVARCVWAPAPPRAILVSRSGADAPAHGGHSP